QGSLSQFGDGSIVIGQEMANALGVFVGDDVEVISSEPAISPIGAMPTSKIFRVVAIFSSGLFDLDSTWTYALLRDVQRLLRTGDVALTVEVKVADIYKARELGKLLVDKLDNKLDFDDWMSLNQSIFHALRLEKIVMFITIGLIVIVAALNIV